MNLGAPVNSAGEETDLYVSPDESFLILVASEKEGGYGGDDLWLSRAVGGKWSELTNLGQPVNSNGYEYGPMISRDGRFLLLSTHRRGIRRHRSNSHFRCSRLREIASSSYCVSRFIALEKSRCSADTMGMKTKKTIIVVGLLSLAGLVSALVRPLAKRKFFVRR